jgi:uncharacterized phage protein gp47/JayE
MPLILDGIEYRNNEAFDIAVAMVDYINTYCKARDIRNTAGDIIHIDVNDASIIWLLTLAHAQRDSIIERMLYALGHNFNIAACSDEQLLNIAQIAKVQRKKPSPTTVVISISALPTGDVHITQDVTVTVHTPETELLFSPAYELTVPAGTTKPLVFIAHKTGAYPVEPGVISTFDSKVANLDTVTNLAAVPGNDWEALNSLRQRLNSDNKSLTDAELAMYAIRSLSGVASCNIFINYGILDPISINGVLLPPRKALLYVNGFSPFIAAEYFKYLSILPHTDGSANVFRQDYITKSGQTLPCYFFTPQAVEIYIKVIIDIQAISQRTAAIQDIILSLNGKQGVGEQITASAVLKAFRDVPADYNILGVTLSMDDAVWTISSAVGVNETVAISRSNIMVEQWSAPQ